MPVTSPESRVVEFDQRAAARASLDTVLMMARAGQTRMFDVNVDVSFTSTDEGDVYFDASNRHRVNIQTAGGGVSSVFDLQHSGFGRDVECFKTDYFRVENELQRLRLETDDSGIVQLVAAKRDENGDYQTIKINPADVSTITLLAIGALSTALERRAVTEEPKNGHVNRLIFDGRGKSLIVSQIALVPQLYTAVTAAGETLGRGDEDVKVNARIILDAGFGRIYQKGPIEIVDSNDFDVRAIDRERQIASHFKLGAHPLGSTDYAVIRPRVKVENRNDPSFTVDTLVQHGEKLERVRSKAAWGDEPVEIARFPATLDTISELARFATQVAKGGSTEWLE